jgi:hypothetical protein
MSSAAFATHHCRRSLQAQREGVAGYVLVHLSSTSSVVPALRSVSIAIQVSPIVAIPVDMMTGLCVRPMRLSNGISTTSNEATLYAGTFKDSRNSTALASNGELKLITLWRAMCKYLLMPRPRRMRFFVEVMQRAPVP